jgi:hypothetical protein
MTSHWTSVLTAPLVDACNSVAIAYQDGFQDGRGQLEQQHSYVPALVESVLDIRGPGEVLSAALWTPDLWHSDGDARRYYDIDVDYHFDHSADSPEARGVSQPRRVSISHRHPPWWSFLNFLKFKIFAVVWVIMRDSFTLAAFLRSLMLPISRGRSDCPEDGGSRFLRNIGN